MHEGRRRFVVMNTKETTLVANVKQYALMLAVQDEEYQELHGAIEYINERQEKLVAMMERKQKLMSRAPKDLREKIFHESRVFDERISAEEVELFGKKQTMKELLKERRKPKWRRGETQLLLGVRLPRWQQLDLEAPKRRVISFCSEWEFVRKTRRRVKNLVAKSRRHHRSEILWLSCCRKEEQ